MKPHGTVAVRASISSPPNLNATLEGLAKEEKVSRTWVVRDEKENASLAQKTCSAVLTGATVPTANNEAFSRVLIYKALEPSGWDLTDQRQAHLEYNTPNGRVDYLLKDALGRVLCVLEAKREDLDAYDAKEQARG